jgi:hypothetical protein
MFDINKINKRYFDIKMGDLKLQVEPPTKKMLNKITSLSAASSEDAIDGLYEAVGMLLRKNKSKTKVEDEIIDELDFDELNAILTAYFGWLSNEKNSPN